MAPIVKKNETTFSQSPEKPDNLSKLQNVNAVTLNKKSVLDDFDDFDDFVNEKAVSPKHSQLPERTVEYPKQQPNL